MSKGLLRTRIFSKFGFGSKNDGGLTKKSTCVSAGSTARKSAGW